jgi:2-succinyl-5-enolpyruvyl-6-hydroxy-3-cyclohexene-1-carboxylate synthase
MISDKHNVQDLIHLLKAHGIQHIVISPGSRNAPLSLSFDSDPFFECYAVVDERSAAFFALGLAQQLIEPVVIVCTSGSAALNYAPAVAEAYYQEIPLIVITADRPLEWIDQGDGQTIRQSAIFGSMARFSANLPRESDDADTHWHNARLINEAILTSMAPVAGPVHLNMPFNEPLYRQVESPVHKIKVIERIEARPMLNPAMAQYLAQEITEAPRVLVLCGMMKPNTALNQALSFFAKQPNVLVLTETISNLHDEQFIACIDRLIMSFDDKDEQAFLPDLLITFGSNIVSKKIKALLRKNKQAKHWHVSQAAEVMDTFQTLSRIIPVEPFVFLEQINEQLPGSPASDYREKFMQRNSQCQSAQTDYLASAPFSDFKVFSILLASLPADLNLQMGNSSVVRYIQLFQPDSTACYYGNRGTSGIDGSVSTAVGAAWASNQTTLLITGDISFFYDSNALWNKHVSPDLKIVLINNGGGGIFRIIEGPESGRALETYFETHHQRNASAFAAQFGLNYWQAQNEAEVTAGLDALLTAEGAGILEIFTPRELNDQVLKEHFRFIKERIKRL